MRLDCGVCEIRDWRPSDGPALIAAADNRRVWRNLHHRFPHPYTQAEADAWFALLAAMPEPSHWAIAVDGVAVGGVGVDLGEGIFAKSAQIGYWLAEPYWGRGIMSAVVAAVAAYALAHFDLVRLEAPVFAWNPASMRVLEKCGLVREGLLRRSVLKDGQLIDQVLYALVR
jgi:ribosomal-protein-alanine N-acetyltransferase